MYLDELLPLQELDVLLRAAREEHPALRRTVGVLAAHQRAHRRLEQRLLHVVRGGPRRGATANETRDEGNQGDVTR